jgi:hypothetical protein
MVANDATDRRRKMDRNTQNDDDLIDLGTASSSTKGGNYGIIEGIMLQPVAGLSGA